MESIKLAPDLFERMLDGALGAGAAERIGDDVYLKWDQIVVSQVGSIWKNGTKVRIEFRFRTELVGYLEVSADLAAGMTVSVCDLMGRVKLELKQVTA